MKAKVEYDTDEVCRIVLDYHLKHFDAPAGMEWVAMLHYTDRVTCELVQKKEV